MIIDEYSFARLIKMSTSDIEKKIKYNEQKLILNMDTNEKVKLNILP